jgi:hypothetical protein
MRIEHILSKVQDIAQMIGLEVQVYGNEFSKRWKITHGPSMQIFLE